MTDYKPDSLNRSRLNHELDDALAGYAAVEPRAGLESRILAHLKATGKQRTVRPWWNWTTVAIAALALVSVTGLAWRFEKARPGRVAHRPVIQSPQLPQRQSGSNRNGDLAQLVVVPRIRKNGGAGIHNRMANSHPRLEQFPCPQPLSEQERLLAAFVAQYPTHAAQIAQARAEALLRDSEEELATSSTGTR